MNQIDPTRRDFLKNMAATVGAGLVPVSMVELAFANQQQNFTFAPFLVTPPLL